MLEEPSSPSISRLTAAIFDITTKIEEVDMQLLLLQDKRYHLERILAELKARLEEENKNVSYKDWALGQKMGNEILIETLGDSLPRLE